MSEDREKKKRSSEQRSYRAPALLEGSGWRVSIVFRERKALPGLNLVYQP